MNHANSQKMLAFNFDRETQANIYDERTWNDLLKIKVTNKTKLMTLFCHLTFSGPDPNEVRNAVICVYKGGDV